MIIVGEEVATEGGVAQLDGKVFRYETVPSCDVFVEDAQSVQMHHSFDDLQTHGDEVLGAQRVRRRTAALASTPQQKLFQIAETSMRIAQERRIEKGLGAIEASETGGCFHL